MQPMLSSASKALRAAPSSFIRRSFKGVELLGTVQGDDADFVGFNAHFNGFVGQGMLLSLVRIWANLNYTEAIPGERWAATGCQLGVIAGT